MEFASICATPLDILPYSPTIPSDSLLKFPSSPCLLNLPSLMWALFGSLTVLVLSFPSDPPFDGDGGFVGVFNDDVTDVNPEDGGGDAMFSFDCLFFSFPRKSC